jgi:hypothetical protein
MARKKNTRLERIECPDTALLSKTTEELLLDGNKDEIFRRQWNKMVKATTKA